MKKNRKRNGNCNKTLKDFYYFIISMNLLLNRKNWKLYKHFPLFVC